MAVNILLKRSATANKRPVGASMAFGELNLNYDAATGGLYYKDTAGAVVKVGPCQVSATAPNSSPAGSSGNSAGEFWFDTATQTLKLYDGTAWVEAGGSVQGVTGSAPITVDNTDPLNPVVGVTAASTTAPGVVQLNDTTSSVSTTEALTANQGRSLQEQINALAVSSNLTLAGTLDASTGDLVTVTTEGTAAGFTIGDPLPAAASGNAEFFVIATVGANSYTPPGGSATEVHVGDWFLSSGTAWNFLDVGFQAAYATTSVAGIVQLATDAEVQAGLNTDHAVVPSSLQSKLSDSVSTTSSTTIASSTAVKAAYDAGVQGQTDAAAAQSTANQAVLDAAAAQSTADQAVLDAATAQSTANQAVLDAAAAQSAADNAQTDATQALSDAAAAQATADAAMPLTGGTFTGSVTFSGGPDAGSISSTGTVVPGSNYDLGVYTNVPLTGGSGSGATADITVTTGPVGVVSDLIITNPGTVYGTEAGGVSNTTTRTITGVGTGLRVGYGFRDGALTGAFVEFGGSGYVVGDTAYVDVALGVPTGDGIIEVTAVTASGGIVSGFTLVSAGVGYSSGDNLTATLPGGSGWQVPVTAVDPGSAILTSNATNEFNGPTFFNGTEVYFFSGSNIYFDPGSLVWFNGDAEINSTFTFNASPIFSPGVDIGASAQVTYDNATSGLTASNVQAAIDELAAEVDGVQGITSTAPITVNNTDPANPVIGIDAASTTGAGAVQLNDTVTSTSTTQAATANAAKTAYDAAVAAQSTANAALPKAGGTMTGNIVFQDAGEGIQFNGGSSIYAISDSISTTSSTTAASSAAVKAAYDAAIAAQTSGPLTSDTVLYVNSTDGNDSTAARGTDKPYATITAALAAASDGDTIFLSAGTFTENFTISKGVHLAGVFCDQATWSGTKILGNVTINLAGGVTRNLAISDIYFISANSTSPVSVTGMSPGAGGINTITGCMFTQQTVTDTNQFAFQTSGTWTRSLYLRECTIDGNFKHNAGTTAGASGYIVIDQLLGVGNSNMYHYILTGTVEYRNPSNSLASIYQTGGIALVNNASAGITPNSATTTAVFGGTGFSYKGTAASVGTGTIYFQGGDNQGSGKVDIGANVVYGWSSLTIDPANLTVNGAAVAYTTAVPAAANAQKISQQRPRLDLLKSTSSVTAANQLATVVDSSTGALYTVASMDAGVY